MKYLRFFIIILAIILAAWFTFQIEMFVHEFRTDFLYQNNWSGLIMLMLLALTLGGIFKLLAARTARRKK
jgi:hypothetical protein